MNEDVKKNKGRREGKFCGNERKEKRKRKCYKECYNGFLSFLLSFFFIFIFSFNESLIIIFFLSLIFFGLEATWYRGLMGQLHTFGFYLVSPSLTTPLLETSVIERSIPWRLTCPISTGIGRGEVGRSSYYVRCSNLIGIQLCMDYTE